MIRTRQRLRDVRRVIGLVLAAVLAFVSAGAAPPSANATPRWDPASTATSHPGVPTVSQGLRCANRASFVFYDSSAVYLGQSAECAGLPGARVRIEGAKRAGKVVYNSRLTREFYGGSWFNDFVLIKLHDD